MTQTQSQPAATAGAKRSSAQAGSRREKAGLLDVIDKQLDEQGEMFADHASDQVSRALRPMLPVAIGMAFMFVGAVLWALGVWKVVQWASREFGSDGRAIMVVAAGHLVIALGMFVVVRLRQRRSARAGLLSPPSPDANPDSVPAEAGPEAPR